MKKLCFQNEDSKLEWTEWKKTKDVHCNAPQRNKVVLATLLTINGSLQIIRKVHCVNLIQKFVMARRSQCFYSSKMFDIDLDSFFQQVIDLSA